MSAAPSPFGRFPLPDRRDRVSFAEVNMSPPPWACRTMDKRHPLGDHDGGPWQLRLRPQAFACAMLFFSRVVA